MQEAEAGSPGSPDWRAAGERIDALIDASASGGVVARERAEELVRLVVDLYGAGLERLLDIVHERGHLGDDVLDALAGDDLVASILLVHGLHPYDTQARVEQALDDVRPYLGSHGGDVELVGLGDDGAVRLRLLGSCDGCASSSVTLKLAVEGAIEAAAPEVTRIEVEEPAAAEGLIPVGALRSRLDETAVEAISSWQPLAQVAELAGGSTTTLDVAGTSVLVCRIATDLYAYLDRCARCEATLDGAVLARRLGAATGEAVLRCPSCLAHYDVRRAGVCLDDETLHLTPLPLLVDAGIPSVAIPASVGT